MHLYKPQKLVVVVGGGSKAICVYVEGTNLYRLTRKQKQTQSDGMVGASLRLTTVYRAQSGLRL